MTTQMRPQTHYRIEHDSLTIHTRDAAAAEHASRNGARVTATTVARGQA